MTAANTAAALEQRSYGLRTPGAIEFLGSSAPKKMLIGGQWVAAQSGKTFESIDPATEQVLAHIAEGDAADVDAAVQAARRAFEHPSWSAITPAQRGAYLHGIADMIERHFDELVELESIDNGMTVSTMRWMVGWAIETWRYYAGWPTKVGFTGSGNQHESIHIDSAAIATASVPDRRDCDARFALHLRAPAAEFLLGMHLSHPRAGPGRHNRQADEDPPSANSSLH